MRCYVKNNRRRIRKKKSDPGKYMFLEQGIIGGVSYIDKR